MSLKDRTRVVLEDRDKRLLYFDVGEFIIATNPKSASTSIKDTCKRRVGKFVRPSGDELLELRKVKEIRYYIRHPMDRIESAYCTLVKRIDKNLVESFVRRLEFSNDIHWNPVVEFHTYKGTFLPTDVRPFESIGEFVDKHINQSARKSIPWGAEALTMIKDRWKVDFDLYESVGGTYTC